MVLHQSWAVFTTKIASFFYDYVVNPENFVINSESKGIYHLPSWRFDLIPDNYFDKILAVQVLPEVNDRLIRDFLCGEFYRVLKPNGLLYLRDHKQSWQPVHELDTDLLFERKGFTKEFEARLVDELDIHGIPRVFRRANSTSNT